jgi:hypothetical protein
MEAKLEEQFCSILLREPGLELFFPQTSKAKYKERALQTCGAMTAGVNRSP